MLVMLVRGAVGTVMVPVPVYKAVPFNVLKLLKYPAIVRPAITDDIKYKGWLASKFVDPLAEFPIYAPSTYNLRFVESLEIAKWCQALSLYLLVAVTNKTPFPYKTSCPLPTVGFISNVKPVVPIDVSSEKIDAY